MSLRIASRVSVGDTCIRWCHVYPLVTRVSICVTCIRWCHVYPLVTRVSIGVTCIRWCHVYPLVSSVSAGVEKTGRVRNAPLGKSDKSSGSLDPVCPCMDEFFQFTKIEALPNGQWPNRLASL